MLQVALVLPYGEVDNAVKPMPKSDGEARKYATKGHIKDIREHMGGKKVRVFYSLEISCLISYTRSFFTLATK